MNDALHHFVRFLRQYPPDAGARGPASDWTTQNTVKLVGGDPRCFTEFLSGPARESFGQGVLRFLLPDSRPSLVSWNSPLGWQASWLPWKDRLVVFAYDWLGRQIGFDRQRVQSGEPLIGILEPGTGEFLETPETFLGFMERELVDFSDAAVAVKFYSQWRENGGEAPRPGKCVGYKVPLFLGGSDTVDNLAISDMEVYISTCGQLVSQTHGLSPGTPIKGVGFKG